MSKTKKFTVLSKEQLVAYNLDAIKRNANQTLDTRKVQELKWTVFPVAFSILHRDVEVRCEVILDPEGNSALLDLTLDQFNGLAQREVTAA